MMESVTKAKPKMWGASIVGFGSYHYIGKSGREGDWMLTGFSPRKQNLTLYLMGGFDSEKELLEKLGKYKTSVGCLYIKKLDDVDKKVLKELVITSVKKMKSQDKKQIPFLTWLMFPKIKLCVTVGHVGTDVFFNYRFGKQADCLTMRALKPFASLMQVCAIYKHFSGFGLSLLLGREFPGA